MARHQTQGSRFKCTPAPSVASPDYYSGDLFAMKNGTSCDISVLDFGAIGDGVSDDTSALQGAINAASVLGKVVCFPAGLYATSHTLLVPAGVSLRGEGMGTNPRAPNLASGSIIGYCGTGYAVELRNAHNAVLEGLVVATTFGCPDPAAALGGVLLNGTGPVGGVESATLRNVFIFRFWGGAGLTLLAESGGGVAYCSFFDVRVRHALTGIHLSATGNGGSFVNSNTFFHGAVSGGGYDYGIRLSGPGACNNNIFIGTVVEPYTTTYGHIFVEGAISQLQCSGCRVEGASLGDFDPLLVFSGETYGSVWDGGITDGGRIDADPLNHDLRGCHGLNMRPSTRNLFPNSGFVGAGNRYGSSDDTPPFWLTTGAISVTVSTSSASWWIGNRKTSSPPPLPNGAFSLNISVAPGTIATLKPESADGLWPPSRASFLECSVGAWMRTCRSSSSIRAVATSIGPNGVESGSPLLQDGEWHYVGLTGGLPDPLGASPHPTAIFYFTHEGSPGSSQEECVEVALPTFTFGRSTISARESQVLTDQGGQVQGTLFLGLSEVSLQASSHWVVEKSGNTFAVTAATVANGGSTTLARLNADSDERMPAGTTIQFVFEVAGITVVDSAYIDLKAGSFTSTDVFFARSAQHGIWNLERALEE